MRQPPGRDPALTLSRTALIIERDRDDRFPRKAGEHHLDWSCHAGGTDRAPLRRDDRATVLCSNRLRPNRPHTGLQSEPVGVWGRHRSLRPRRSRSARDLQRVRRGAAPSRSATNGVLGVDVAARAELRFPPAPVVTIRVIHFSSPGRVEALEQNGSVVDTRLMAHAGGRAGAHPARYRDRPRRCDATHPRGRDAGHSSLCH